MMKSKSLERFRRELQRTWSVRNSVNWNDRSFTPDKAYLMAIFAKIAYLVIPEYELPTHSMAKIIPCLTYQQLLALRYRFSLEDYLRGVDFLDPIIIISERAIAVAVVRHDLTVISLRGTRPLYVSDWLTDLRASRMMLYAPNTQSRTVKLHTGFMSSTLDFVEELADKVSARIKSLGTTISPIYVTGHSLGGALTAIVSGLANVAFFTRLRYGSNIGYRLPVHSAYMFGTPRYGDEAAIASLAEPHHTLNPFDLVPTVPPRWLGFADPPQEYLVTSTSLAKLAERPPAALGAWIRRADRLRGIRYHFIERYIRQLAP